MSRKVRWATAPKGLATVLGMGLMMTACQDSVTEPALEDPSETAAAAAITVEMAQCDGQALAMNPPPGWPYLYGTAGDDKLMVTEGWAIVFGRAGNDCLLGAGGNDSLFGEAGDDVLVGGAGRDYASGGPGTDWIRTGAGDDYVNVADGESDDVDAGAGEDEIIAADGAIDTIECGPGHDVVYADGDDVLSGCEEVVVVS